MTVDDLAEYGMERMDDDDIVSFLSTRSFGVLGLSAEETPYLIPMSYGFDGESRLYFGYVVGSQSRKAELSDRADAASFLVYSVETMFHWQSVLATRTLRPFPDETSNATAVEGRCGVPNFETASEADETSITSYRSRVDGASTRDRATVVHATLESRSAGVTRRGRRFAIDLPSADPATVVTVYESSAVGWICTGIKRETVVALVT